MRKLIVLMCSLAICLTGCAPTGDRQLRAREDRHSPDPALGTENRESQVYKTQILAAPPAAVIAPPAAVPAKLPAKPAPTHATPASAQVRTPSGL